VRGALVRNAIEHGDDPVALAADGAGEAVIITVSNRGAPLPAALAPRLFAPVRGATKRGRRLGLGLFMAREIARAHGGDLTARAPAGGAAFVLRWPRA
jgi:signal transduction histidine kinase